MKKQFWMGAALVLGTGLVLSVIGALVGIHNRITPHVPSGLEGGLIGGGIGLLLGGLLVGVSAWRSKPLGRGLGGAVLGALLGLSLGLRGPGIAVPPGLLGTLAGALLGGTFFLLIRSRVLLGALACLWAAGLVNPERYDESADESRTLAELPSDQAALDSAADVTPRPVGLISPGTVIGDRPPEGWSHLVIKSRYKIANPEGMPSAVVDGVASIFTSILARVETVPGADGPSYRLADLALGAGASIAGQDTIVSTATRGKLKADLGLVGGMTLAEHEKRWPKVLIRARSSTMRVLDDPTFLYRDGGHHPVVLRYTALVEPKTGRLETLVWRVDVDPSGKYLGAVGPLEWLPPNLVGCCLLHHASPRFTFGFPELLSMAVISLPPGHAQIPIPDSLREMLGLLYLSPSQAGEMERGLRSLVFPKPPG